MSKAKSEPTKPAAEGAAPEAGAGGELTPDQQALVEQAQEIERLQDECADLRERLDGANAENERMLARNGELHARVRELEGALTDANASTPVPMGGMRTPMDRWDNPTQTTVRVPLHDRAGRPVLVEVEPAGSVEIPATMRHAVRALAPQLVLSETE